MKNSASVSLSRITGFLDKELRTGAIEDLSRNGLQVEGAEKVSRVALAVDACAEAYDKAADKGCQMIIAHHGIIWGGLPSITGSVCRQLRTLLEYRISLYAAHLPLDLHPRYGNNARLAAILGLKGLRPFGDYQGTLIGCEGKLPAAACARELSDRLARALGGKNVILPFGKQEIRRLGIVSGRAGDILEEAIEKGLDCFITGEPGHEHWHRAKEARINVIYCGHYYSEKPGVQALGRLLENEFGIESIFLDIPTAI